MLGLSCSMWDLVPWLGIKPGLLALGAWHLSHWTTREVSYDVILFFFFFFSWKIIALHCCLCFCDTTVWVSHKNTRVSSLWTSLPPPAHLSCHRTPAELPVLYSNFPLAICFTYGNVHISMLLSQLITPSPLPTGSTGLFFMSPSLFLPCR